MTPAQMRQITGQTIKDLGNRPKVVPDDGILLIGQNSKTIVGIASQRENLLAAEVRVREEDTVAIPMTAIRSIWGAVSMVRSRVRNWEYE